MAPRRKSAGGTGIEGSAKKGKMHAASSAASGHGSDAPSISTCTFPWLEEFKQELNTLLETHSTPSCVLEYYIPRARIHEWAEVMDGYYPPDKNIEYLQDWTPGVKNVRFWMGSWAPMAGNAGHVLHEKFKALVLLILCNGFETDPYEHHGVDVPLIEPLHAACFAAGDLGSEVPGYPQCARAGGAGFVKGWRRFMAANMVQLILQKLGKLDEYKTLIPPKVLKTWSSQKAQVLNMDLSRSIDVSRGRECVNIVQTIYFSLRLNNHDNWVTLALACVLFNLTRRFQK